MRGCASDPDWMLEALSRGLGERYGRLAVGFARTEGDAQSSLQLLGLCNAEGQSVLEPPRGFRPGRKHRSVTLGAWHGEQWFDAATLGAFGESIVDTVFAVSRSAFLVSWLIDRPADWFILILSPLAAPSGQRNDRSMAVNANLLATNLLRALDARRLERANAWIQREMEEEIARLQKLRQPDELTRMRVDSDYSYRRMEHHMDGGVLNDDQTVIVIRFC